MRKEIVIIGGGVTGLFTAYFLSKKGFEDVVILEKEFVGYGSTGRCGSGIRAQFDNKKNIEDMRQSIKMWGELAKELKFDFNQGGYLYLHYDEEELEKFREIRRLQNSVGVPTQTVSPSQIEDINTYIDTSKLAGGTFNQKDGKADPFDVVFALKKWLGNTEIGIMQKTEVIGVGVEGKSIKAVKTSKDKIETETVLNAAGGWAPKIGDMMGIKIPIAPFRHQAVITEPLKTGEVDPMVIAPKYANAYFTQTKDGGIVGGVETPPTEKTTYSMDESLDFEERIAKIFTRIMPCLDQIRIIRHWAGYYAMTPDNNPLLGEFKLEGHYLAAGYSGHGYMMGPAVGKSMAELMVNGKSSIDLEYYDPYRIERGELREVALKIG
ncbi:MAG TPA: FAD-binding oxidoreductase [Thermoplasmata archaeon]|nr:FAD-binding oxidoreductase [Thermoplasmata archaeon]